VSDVPNAFDMAPPDPAPLPRTTRLEVDWDGARWAETDPASGTTLAIGEAVHEEKRAA